MYIFVTPISYHIENTLTPLDTESLLHKRTAGKTKILLPVNRLPLIHQRDSFLDKRKQ